MALEYKLSYTAEEIDENLGLVGKNKEDIVKINENVQTVQENISTINEGIVDINKNIEDINVVLDEKSDKEHTHPGQESFSEVEPNGQSTGDYWMKSY